MSYSIEKLDVYRKSVTTGAGLCRAATRATEGGAAGLADRLVDRALAIGTNLVDGLGFWEKEHKEDYFSASKRAVLETLPLLELMRIMDLLPEEEHEQLAGGLRDLAKMISGLLRGARRRGSSTPANGREAAHPARGEVSCH